MKIAIGSASAGMIIYLVILGVALLIGFIEYILQAIAFQRIAKRRMISKGWFAWFPVLNQYLFGSIIDDYDATMGHKRGWRKISLATSIIALVILILFIGVAAAIVFTIGMDMNLGHGLEYAMTEMSGVTALLFVAYFACGVAMLFVALISMMAKTICLFKLYESLNSKHAVLLFFLSQFVFLAETISIFALRNKGYSRQP